MELTGENVEKVFASCLDDTADEVEGIVGKARLNVSGHEDEISSMLSQLPENFQHRKGGGWSFLNACNRADGEQWTGLHQTMEKLVMLGIASGQAAFLLPREMWDVLPGGVPYFSVGAKETMTATTSLRGNPSA